MMFHRENDWAHTEAEKIVNAFLAYEGSDDLLLLQQAIAAALSLSYQRGRDGTTPDIDSIAL